MKKNKLAKMIDHTLLKPEATMFDVINLCEEAKKYGMQLQKVVEDNSWIRAEFSVD